MQLLAPDVGWFLREDVLYWTNDGGRQWTDITPPTTTRMKVAGVFFLNTSEGWAVLARYDETADTIEFVLASTSSAGASWSVIPLRVPEGVGRSDSTFVGSAEIFFLDSANGWLNLGLVGSSNFRPALMLATSDGGNSWRRLPGHPRTGGKLFFLNQNDGWLAGGPGNLYFYATKDGGDSWQRVELEAPRRIYPAIYAHYEDAPVFRDSKHGFLPVTYKAAGDHPGALVLFATHDGGRTWMAERTLPSAPLSNMPATVADSTLIAAKSSREKRVTLTRATSGHKSERTAEVGALVDSPWFAPIELSFADVGQGWMIIALRGTAWVLWTTRNGGSTWSDITPQRIPRPLTIKP